MRPSETALLATADALISSGLAALGYEFVNLDDGIMVGRFANGTLQPDPKFPNGMRYLTDQIHARGLKAGLYTDRGPTTCGGRPAAQGNEALDAATYAGWQVRRGRGPLHVRSA